MSALDSLRAELAAADERLAATAAGLSDADVAAPSSLPGWSRGHVLTHVARNADSHVNLLVWARTGIVTPQYPDPGFREAAIAAGAGRGAREQLADLRASAERLAKAIAAVPAEGWSTMVGGLRPPTHPAWYTLVRRLREVELHHVDLGAGYTPADWPEEFVLRELHDCRALWPYGQSTVGEIRVTGGETWTDLGEGPVVEGSARDLLVWLTGRSAGEGIRVVREGHDGPQHPLPEPPPWMTAPAPEGLPAAPPQHYPTRRTP